jgi:hypothetical protein
VSVDIPFSPELESPYEAAARNLASLVAWARDHDSEGARNEATTRLHLIDTLLMDCLAWPREEIKAEEPYEGTFADYHLGRGSTKVIVEAKKEGIYFELPIDFTSRTAKLATLRQLGEPIAKALEQAMNYCLTRGVPLGVVSNGHQIIAFIGSRQDGVPPADGRAVVFTSLEDMQGSFPELWNSLSRPGVDAHRLYARLQGQTQPVGCVNSSAVWTWPVCSEIVIVDNGSSHRGQKAVDRLQQRWSNLILVHLPVHASWLNQIEIYYSILQRKVLEPNDFDNLADVARRLNAFERHWNEIAEPFDWHFTRDDLAALIERLAAHQPQLQLAA